MTQRTSEDLAGRSPDLAASGMTEPDEPNRGARIRTGDLLLPKQARYRATLRPAIGTSSPVRDRAARKRYLSFRSLDGGTMPFPRRYTAM